MAMNLAVSWWAIVLRGAAAILFGLFALIFPPAVVTALVLLFGAYAILDGALNLAAAMRAPQGGRRWGWLAFEGSVSLVIGLIAFFWPGPTAVALVYMFAFWALVTGIAKIAAAVRLRRQIRGEWLLGLSGGLSVAFGILLFIVPGAGLVVIAICIGVYAIVFGALLVGLGLRLRAWSRGSEPQIPAGARTV
jgi:uncharacterized membrane protein HdeD (DUF308 family)